MCALPSSRVSKSKKITTTITTNSNTKIHTDVINEESENYDIYIFLNLNSTAKQNTLNPGLKITIPGIKFILKHFWCCENVKQFLTF